MLMTTVIANSHRQPPGHRRQSRPVFIASASAVRISEVSFEYACAQTCKQTYCTFVTFQQCGGQTHKPHETATFLLATLTKIHRLKKITGTLSNKRFLIWLGLFTIPPHFKYVTTVPSNLSFIACFLTLIFHKVVWQHIQGVMGFLIRFTAHLLENQTVKEL